MVDNLWYSMVGFFDVTNRLERECGLDLLHGVFIHFRRRGRSPIRAPFDGGREQVLAGAIFEGLFISMHLIGTVLQLMVW